MSVVVMKQQRVTLQDHNLTQTDFELAVQTVTDL